MTEWFRPKVALLSKEGFEKLGIKALPQSPPVKEMQTAILKAYYLDDNVRKRLLELEIAKEKSDNKM